MSNYEAMRSQAILSMSVIGLAALAGSLSTVSAYTN